jgi:selenocysteine lyase/cysteine desulfurase
LEPIEGVNWEEIYKKEHELRKKAEKELEDLKKKIDPLEKMRIDGL